MFAFESGCFWTFFLLIPIFIIAITMFPAPTRHWDQDERKHKNN